MSQTDFIEKDDISLDVFTHKRAYGSPNAGGDYGCVGWLTKPICTFSLSLGHDAFGRMVFQKTDGMTITVGGTELPDVCKWTFDASERFQDIQVYTSAGRLVGVMLRTNHKTCRAEVKSFNSLSPPPTANKIDVGSGVCVGVFGNSDIWMQSLGFAMLKTEVAKKLSVDSGSHGVSGGHGGSGGRGSGGRHGGAKK